MKWLRETSLDWFMVCAGIGALVGLFAPRGRTVPAALIAAGVVTTIGLILGALGYDL